MSHIATCGHEISDGITTSVDEGQICSDGSPAITYGTYCDKCVQAYFNDGKLLNKELSNILQQNSELKEDLKWATDILKDSRYKHDSDFEDEWNKIKAIRAKYKLDEKF